MKYDVMSLYIKIRTIIGPLKVDNIAEMNYNVRIDKTTRHSLQFLSRTKNIPYRFARNCPQSHPGFKGFPLLTASIPHEIYGMTRDLLFSFLLKML